MRPPGVWSGAQDSISGLRYADDPILMPLQCGTQWDALSHIFHEGKCITSMHGRESVLTKLEVNSIDKLSERVLGLGVLVDMPSYGGLGRLRQRRLPQGQHLGWLLAT